MTMLAAAVPQDQKQMLGKKLFPRMYPDFAGKITGILLEKENKEILKRSKNRIISPLVLRLSLKC